MVLLFIACALVPVSALALFAYRQVSRQLEAQGRASLREAGKLAGMPLLERLDFLNDKLRAMSPASTGDPMRTFAVEPEPADSPDTSREHFLSVVLRVQGERVSTLAGDDHVLDPSATLTVVADAHLATGRSLLHVLRDGTGPRVFLIQRLDPTDPARGELWAELEPEYLFTGGLGKDGVPTGMELCLLDGEAHPLYCPNPPGRKQLDALAEAIASRSVDAVGWEGVKGEYLAGFWTAFLGYSYGSDDWTVMLSEPRSLALAPVAEFRQVFLLIAILVVVLAFLFSNIQIRHNLEPLDRLKAGTERIARRDFGTPVEVRSGDEFEILAGAINAMGRSLASQFAAMAALGEIDRAVLSALRTEAVIEIVLARASDVTACDAVAVGIIGDESELCLSGSGTHQLTSAVVVHRPDDTELSPLRRGDVLRFGPDLECPAYLSRALAIEGPHAQVLVFPLRTSEALLGLLALGYLGEAPEDDDALNRDRKLADQITVALENAALVERLDRLTVGTLDALARTVDSKSPWTAGHSKRVAELAVRLGQVVELPEPHLEVLYRGALLHDIGKIGVPAAILNKPARLTDDEMERIREHPEIGFRILSPIESLADILPIVRNHHERYAGGGYPDGTPARELSDLVRLVTVVDTYDTLVNDRPYRDGLEPEGALQLLVEGSGSQFDPEFVAALVTLVRDHGDGQGACAAGASPETASAQAEVAEGTSVETSPLKDAVA
jgi:putative nucleotidyltransferase with HDIG domain